MELRETPAQGRSWTAELDDGELAFSARETSDGGVVLYIYTDFVLEEGLEDEVVFFAGGLEDFADFIVELAETHRALSQAVNKPQALPPTPLVVPDPKPNYSFNAYRKPLTLEDDWEALEEIERKKEVSTKPPFWFDSPPYAGGVSSSRELVGGHIILYDSPTELTEEAVVGELRDEDGNLLGQTIRRGSNPETAAYVWRERTHTIS